MGAGPRRNRKFISAAVFGRSGFAEFFCGVGLALAVSPAWRASLAGACVLAKKGPEEQ